MRKRVILAFSVGITLAFFTPSVSVAIGAQEGLRTARQARRGAPPLEAPYMSAILGPMPQLDPIARFIPPVDPWEHAALGWGVEALDENGVPFCMTNHPPATTCDPEGPRAFLHAGVDVRPAADRVVRASAQGRVVIVAPTSAPVAGRGPGEGGGIVVLEHDVDGDPSTLDDRLLTVYGHVDPQVSTGAIVGQGDPIALTSTVGGSHLHFAVRRAPFDPADVDVYRTLLPPEGTSQCVGCYSRPLPVPAFPDRWEDPDRLLRGPSSWLAIYGRGEDAAYDLLETDDGYLAFGYTWNPAAPGRSLAVRRLDREGNIVWQRAYYASDIDIIRRVKLAPDGGAIVLARSTSMTRPGKRVPMLLKFDAAGELQWQRKYEGTTITNSAVDLWWEDIAVTGDGGYVVTGSAQLAPAVPAAAAVARLDAVGNVLWLRSYDAPFATLGFDGKGIAPLADGGFVIVAEYQIHFEPPPSTIVVKDLLVFRIDADGQLLWGTAVSNGLGDARAGQIETTPDGGSIVVGYRALFGPTVPPITVWILKLNGDGTIAWNSFYGSPNAGVLIQSATRLVVTNDGGYVVGGHRRALFDLGGPQFEVDNDLFMMRLDGAGGIVAQRRIDPIGKSMTVLGLRAAADGGFLLAGGPEIECRLCSFLSGVDDTRFLVAHLDADFDISGGCTSEGDFVGLSQTPVGVQFDSFPVGTLIATPVETTLARVDTAERRYLCDDGAYGAPPVIEATSIVATQQTVSCDRTEYIEAQLCTLGVTGAQATSPVMLNVTYDSLRIAALVVDGDSTPEENDVVGVDAFIHALNEGGGTIPMLDDGSATNVSDFFDNVTTCYEDPFAGVCTCGSTNPPTFSGDAVSGDDVYTREPPLSFPPVPEVARGCMIEASPRRPMFNYPAGAPVSVGVRAKDHIGNVSGTSTSVIPAGASMSCVGDPCGCCLLISRDPIQQCTGLDGMPSPDFPAGICHAF